MRGKKGMSPAGAGLSRQVCALWNRALFWGRKRITGRIVSGSLAGGMILAAVFADSGITARADKPPAYQTAADGPTLDTYKEKMDMSRDSRNSGRIWTDKTVETTDGTGFTETLSALGSGLQFTGTVPSDTVIVFDNSKSMYMNDGALTGDDVAGPESRIGKTVAAINYAIDKLMRANGRNRVAVVTFAKNQPTEENGDPAPGSKNTAVTVLKMGRHEISAGRDGPAPYLTVHKNSNGGGYITAYNGRTEYNNGYTNIQAGISQGMQTLLKASEDHEVMVAGTKVNRIPSLILMTDGQATDGLADVGEGSMANLGFINDFTDNQTSFTGGSTWNQFIKKLLDTEKTASYEYALVSEDEKGKPDGECAGLYTRYKESQEYLLLSTLITAGYFKGRVTEAYKNPCKIYTISLDIDPAADEEITSNGPTMNPNQYFGEGNSSWLDRFGTSKYPEGTVGHAMVEAIREAPDRLEAWRNGDVTLRYQPIKSGTDLMKEWNLSYPALPYPDAVKGSAEEAQNKASAEYAARMATRDAMKAKIKRFLLDGSGQSIHRGFYIVGNQEKGCLQEREGKQVTLPRLPDRSEDAVDINYVDAAYYPKTESSAEGSIQDAFEAILSRTVDYPVGSPIRDYGGTDGYLTITDPIGEYMEISGDTMTLNLWGTDYAGTLVQSGKAGEKILDFGTAKAVNPAYKEEFSLNDIHVSVTEAGAGAARTQTLKLEIPSHALPTRVCSVAESSSGYSYTGDCTTSPLRLTYSLDLVSDLLTDSGDIDLGAVRQDYIADHTDPDTGEVCFYTNRWRDGESARSSFTASDGNNFYRYLTDPQGNKVVQWYDLKQEYNDPVSDGGGVRPLDGRDEPEPKAEDNTGTKEGAYCPKNENGTVIAELNNNGILKAAPASLEIKKEVTDPHHAAGAEDRFTFDIYLEGRSGDIAARKYKKDDPAGSLVSVAFTADGHAMAELKAGERILFEKLAPGKMYSVQETGMEPAEDYGFVSVSSTNRKDTPEIGEKRIRGKIARGGTGTSVLFVNRIRTDLMISKKVLACAGGEPQKPAEGGDPIDTATGRTFAFRVTVEGMEGTAKATVATETAGRVSDSKETDVLFRDGKTEIELRHNQTITIKGLPAGASYEVRETEEAFQPYDSVLRYGYESDAAGLRSGILGKKSAEQVSMERFTNRFAPKPAAYELKGRKILDAAISGGDGPGRKTQRDGGRAGEVFTFRITPAESNNSYDPVTKAYEVFNQPNGEITFFDGTGTVYKVPGTYRYVIEEAAPNGNQRGLAYDPSRYTVTVKVVQNPGNPDELMIDEEDTIIQKAVYSGEGGETVNEVNFYNIRSPHETRVQFAGEKRLKGAEIREGQFRFELSPAGFELASDANGKRAAGPADHRDVPAASGADAAESREEKGVDGSETDRSAAFGNVRQDPSCQPMPENGIYTAANSATGAFWFDSVCFTEEGTYRYRLRELALENGKPNENIIFDEKEYAITVEVTGDDSDGTLSAAFRFDGGDRDGMFFTNTYIPPKLAPVKEQAKTEVRCGSGMARGGDPASVEEGDVVTYYLSVPNDSENDILDLVVYDTVPEGCALIEESITGGGYLKEDGRTIEWRQDRLSARRTWTAEFSVSIPDVREDTVYTNIAYACSGEAGDENLPDGTAAVIAREGVPHIAVEKTQEVNSCGVRTREPVTADGRDTITYYLTVTSDGTETARDVSVTDRIPQYTEGGEYLPLVLSEGSIGGEGESEGNLSFLYDETTQTITWKLGDMEGKGLRDPSFHNQDQTGTAKTVWYRVTVPDTQKDTGWKNVCAVYYGNPPKDHEPGDEDETDKPAAGTPGNPVLSNAVEIRTYPEEIEEGTPGSAHGSGAGREPEEGAGSGDRSASAAGSNRRISPDSIADGSPGDIGGGIPGGFPDSSKQAAVIPDEQIPLAYYKGTEDDTAPPLLLIPLTGDDKPAGAAVMLGLTALGMMGVFGMLARKKDKNDA